MTSAETPDVPDEPKDRVADSPAELDATPATNAAGPTLKELVAGEVDEADLPPNAREAVAKVAQAALQNINRQQNQALIDAFQPLERNAALRKAALARNILGTFDTKRLLGPMLEQLMPTIDPLNERIRAQLSASLPASPIAKQFETLQNVVKNLLPKNAFSKVNVPQSVFKNLYGPEFSGIASKLVNFQKLFENVDWERITAGWYPPNWDRDRGIEQYATFIELAADEGLPMTWVPNTELTYLLAEAASTEARAELLVQHSETIVDDCRTVLSDFDDQSYIVEQLRKTLGAFDAGFHEAAQAHAASIIDTALREIFIVPTRWSYPSVKKLLHTGEDWESTELRSARLLPTSVALLNLLEEFRTDRGDPVPTRPNRHAAAHAVHPDQYTQVNAIKFLMLATAVLAEIAYDGWARVLDKAA